MPIYTPQGSRVFVDGLEITDHWQPNGHWEGPDVVSEQTNPHSHGAPKHVQALDSRPKSPT